MITLEVLLEEIRWLERTRHDDSVSATQWQRRGNQLILDAAQLPPEHLPVFVQYFEAFQSRE